MPNKNSMNNTLSTLDTFSIVLWVCSIQCEESRNPACLRAVAIGFGRRRPARQGTEGLSLHAKQRTGLDATQT